MTGTGKWSNKCGGRDSVSPLSFYFSLMLVLDPGRQSDLLFTLISTAIC